MKTPLCLILAASMLTACTTPAGPPPPGRVRTTDQVNRGSLVGAASSPLRDINLLRTKIPQVLLDALSDPYARPNPMTCAEIRAQIAPLDEALGPDMDQPKPTKADQGLIADSRDFVGDEAMRMAVGAAQDIIPYRGWVRKLTGAERHDKLVRSAITAGAVRRGYLKGVGLAKGCKPPAAPTPYVGPPIKMRDPSTPKYPIR
ncbi:MAG TPA: hypothetical protein VEA44_10120 [Caulobacter sp.]|nr:hypothetical protein [Caulobacter sp.]